MFLSDFNQQANVSTNVFENPRHKTQANPKDGSKGDGRTDRFDEANSHFSETSL
jgi:hypothetical protein